MKISKINFIKLLIMLLLFFSLQGCGMKSELVKEMDDAYLYFGGNIIGDKKIIRDKKIDEIAQKYFPVGSSVADAIKYLEDNGFVVYEYTENGYRKLPDKDIKKYEDEPHKISALKLMTGTSGYSASIKYGLSPFKRKEARILLDVNNDGIILSAKGRIFIHGL